MRDLFKDKNYLCHSNVVKYTLFSVYLYKITLWIFIYILFKPCMCNKAHNHVIKRQLTQIDLDFGECKSLSADQPVNNAFDSKRLWLTYQFILFSYLCDLYAIK